MGVTVWVPILLTLGVVGAAHSKEPDLPETVELDGKILVLNGVAEGRVGPGAVYVGGLYIPKKTTDSMQILSSNSLREARAVMRRDLSTDCICRGCPGLRGLLGRIFGLQPWQKNFERNLSSTMGALRGGTLAAGVRIELLDQFETFCDLLETEAEERGGRLTTDDVFVFSYVPSRGTEFRMNGVYLGRIDGKGFNDALLATWIGTDPLFGKSFRRGVLEGGAQPP